MKKTKLIFLLLSLASSLWAAPDPNNYFIITVKTDNPGTSNNTQFTIPTLNGLAYEYSVDCDGNGSFETTGQVGNYTCAYGTAGTYNVKILADAVNNTQGFPAIYFANAGDKLKVLDIVQWGVNEWTTMAGAFWGTSNMTVTASDIPNFDSLTNLKLMFSGALLANPNTTNWNVSGVTDMTAMFQGASSANPNVSNWDTGNVELMNFMFAAATIAEPDMSQWDIGKVIDMTGMFNIVSLQKSTYDAALKNFSSQTVQPNVVFHGGNSQYCAIAQHLMLSNPNTNNWTITDNGTSTGCNSVDDFVTAWTPIGDGIITIPTFGTGYYYRVDWNNDGDMNDADESTIYTGDATHNYGVNTYQQLAIKGVFPRIHIANGAERLKLRDIWQWGNIKWQSMENAFRGAENLFALPTTSVPDLSQTTNLNSMFADATLVVLGLTNALSSWDTSTITSMNSMFKNTTSSPEIGNWNTSSVQDMSYMFAGAIDANPDTSLWDTSQVTDMIGMFQGAVSANPDTSLWDTSKVITMEYMFDGATNALPDTSNWDTSSVKSMDYMFRNVPFANPDTRNWDISSIQLINNGVVILQRFGFRGMFSGVKLNTNTYDELLNIFATTAIHNNLELDAGTSNLCHSVSAKFVLENNKNWMITDSGQNCSNESDDFVIVVKTDNPGNTTSTQFRIPVFNDLNNPHSYNVSCRDNGAFNAGGVGGGYTCNYSTPGIYQIRIVDATGNGSGFPNIYFNNSGDRLKILDIKQWGTSKWQTMKSAFWGTANMIVTAKDAPDLSQATSLENMFRGARRANPDTKNWDVSTITTMKRMFAGDYVANPDTRLWDTSQVTDMSYMFWQAFNTKADMSSWNIGQVTTMFQMFNGVTLPTPIYDAALINFDSQPHNTNVGFTAGSSMYCDGLNAKANLMGDGWVITDAGQECTPSQPTYEPQQLSAPNDNTPLVRVSCSEPNNTIKLFFTGGSYNFTQVASHLCTVTGLQDFAFTNPVQDGDFFVQTTETKNGDESVPSELPFAASFFINTAPPPDPTSIQLNPNPAANGTAVGLFLSGIQWGAIVTITGMTCETPAPISGFVNCLGTVGQNGLDGTNNTISIANTGNINTNTSTGLIVDNDAPAPPVINPINEADNSITGTAEVNSTISVSGAICSNNPVVTNSSGVWNCVTSGLVAGSAITATATDEVGNESPNSAVVIVTGVDNTPPNAPVVNAILDIDLVITGTAEALSTQTITGANCTNTPVNADNNGDWICHLPLALTVGTLVTVTSTDAANNTSVATQVFVSTSNAIVFSDGFE